MPQQAFFLSVACAVSGPGSAPLFRDTSAATDGASVMFPRLDLTRLPLKQHGLHQLSTSQSDGKGPARKPKSTIPDLLGEMFLFHQHRAQLLAAERQEQLSQLQHSYQAVLEENRRLRHERLCSDTEILWLGDDHSQDESGMGAFGPPLTSELYTSPSLCPWTGFHPHHEEEEVVLIAMGIKRYLGDLPHLMHPARGQEDDIRVLWIHTSGDANLALEGNKMPHVKMDSRAEPRRR
eukprot:superscaffoldBa00003947_g17995